MVRLHPAYIAGLLDSDGHVSWERAGRRPLIGATNTSRPLMDALVETCGGHTARHDTRRVCGEDCRRRHVHVRAVCWSWALSGPRAVIVLEAVRPYVVGKGDRIDEVLACWRGSFAGMERLTRRLRSVAAARAEMAERGWAEDTTPLPPDVCMNGHELTPENVYMRNGGRWRLCKECHREKQRTYALRRAA